MSKASDSPTVTIRHVAAHAGVSIKTVSRVLNCEPGVIPETQALVRASVAALNYSPNPSARNLASVVSNMIGFAYQHISPEEDDMRGGHQYSRLLQIGALEACERHGFGLIPIPCDTRAQDLPERLVMKARERRLGGLVIAAPLGNNAFGMLETLNRAGMPHVCISPNDLEHDAPCVAIEEQSAAYEMAKHLIGQGHRRIGFVTGLRNLRVTQARYEGYLQAMEEHGLPVDPRWVAQGEFTFASGIKCGENLLSLSPPVTAIFASNDDMAVGVMHAAYARGIRIPEDLSVAGFDDTELARFSWPPLTTIRQPLEQMAQTAVAQLIGLIRPQRVSGEALSPRAIFPCKLIARASVAPPSDSPIK
ncbi:LacI family DNA-binding transcriptional regulator [Pseudoduganella sp. UC29_106]|uniref:LacI family DNA-binding transcriptional regulator n=1 Tax=Pseudoduganella sp. UC29_106 TaxID=3374553 RepID=UPI0037576098